MQITIPFNITSRIYNKHNSKVPFAFIFDEISRVYYLLKGNIALLWDIILHQKDFDAVFCFAKQKNIVNELNQLLSELKHKKFIDIPLDFPFSEYKYLSSLVNTKDKDKMAILEDYLIQIMHQNDTFSNLILQLSYECNLKCKHCFNPKNISYDRLSFDVAKKAIDEIDELNVAGVGLTGGECTIHPDFLKIAQYIRSKYLTLVFLTNGLKLYDDKDLLKEIIKLHPYEIRLSLYSMNPEIHDNITNHKGSHAKTLHVIKELKNANINVAVNCPILTLNLGEHKKIREFAQELGINFTNSCVFINNHDNNNECLRVDEKYSENYYYELIKEKGDYAQKFIKDDKPICTNTGVNMLCLAPNQDINPCNDFNYPLGNYKTDSFKYVRSHGLVEFRKKFIKSNLKDCFKEDYCQYCFYCPKTACVEGQILGKSKSLCQMAKSYSNALKRLK